MLISASPVSSVIRLQGTNFYLASSRTTSDLIFKIDVVNFADTVNDSPMPIINIWCTVNQIVQGMVQIGSTPIILLIPKLTKINYATQQVLTISTEPIDFRFIDCIDSSTCILLDSSMNNYYIANTANFLGGTTLVTTQPFFSPLPNIEYIGLRCFNLTR